MDGAWPPGHPRRMTKDIDRFAAQVRAARKHRGLSQEQLATMADVSPETISNLERAKFGPTFEVVAAIIRALDLDPADVFRRDDRRRKPPAQRLEREAALQNLARQLDDASLTLLFKIAMAIQETTAR